MIFQVLGVKTIIENEREIGGGRSTKNGGGVD